MNVILYTRDFEPITCIDLPLDLLEAGEKDGYFNLVLKQPVAPGQTLTLPKPILVECLKINWLDGTLKSVLVTADEEPALMLKPEWLVGQRVVVKAYERMIRLLTDKIKKTRPND